MNVKLSNPPSLSQPRLWFYCNVCWQRFRNVGELLDHWKWQHTKEFIRRGGWWLLEERKAVAPQRPETKLMGAIFGHLDDDDLHQSVQGVSLRDALFAVLEETSQAQRRKHPALVDRINRLVALRFGFHDGRCRTLDEIGKEFDVTRERIRQQESTLLRLLKQPLRVRRLKPFIRTEGG